MDFAAWFRGALAGRRAIEGEERKEGVGTVFRAQDLPHPRAATITRVDRSSAPPTKDASPASALQGDA